MNQQSVRQNQQPALKRSTEYTKEIGETICGRLVEDGNLRSICAEPGIAGCGDSLELDFQQR
jgi:hypothetical protein